MRSCSAEDLLPHYFFLIVFIVLEVSDVLLNEFWFFLRLLPILEHLGLLAYLHIEFWVLSAIHLEFNLSIILFNLLPCKMVDCRRLYREPFAVGR